MNALAICQVSTQEMRPGTLITVTGTLDETANMERYATSKPPIVVDLGGVQFVSSLGVREWVRFLRGASKTAPVRLRRCPEPMVLQFNMVTATVEGAEVESFQAPYLCDKCGREESIVLDVRKDFPAGRRSTPPDRVCAECGARSTFAEMPERYLLFLA